MIRIGFIVNPYAGMGGAVGLKGTDFCVEEAETRGAVPESPLKAIRFLSGLTRDDIQFLTADYEMGAYELSALNIPFTCVYRYQKDSLNNNFRSSAIDTKNACNRMIKKGVDIIIFCGGDGTARDVFSCSGQTTPILGIPAGVKIYSGVFATTPESASRQIMDWDSLSLAEGDVMDVDEEQYRIGHLNTRLFGIAKIPFSHILCQSSKQISFGDESQKMHEIASFITEIMRDDTLYLLGAGTTTKTIADHLKISKTLLGIDAVYQNQLIETDLNEAGILKLLNQYDKVKIIVSPIGAQGFILGRGNQQISREVIKRTGTEALIVVGTEAKLANTQSLFIDTGDPEINSRFGGTIRIICGYRMAIRVKINQ